MNDPFDNASEAPACLPLGFAAWLAGPLLALALGAGGIVLSENWPRPATSAALHMMLAAQVLIGAILFPRQLGGWRIALLVVASSWPMLLLAGIVSEKALASILAGGLLMTLWIAGLAGWSHIFRSHRLQLISAAAALVLSAGDAALFYLAREFGGAWTGAGPLIGVIRQVDQPWSAPTTWSTCCIVLLGAWIVIGLRR